MKHLQQLSSIGAVLGVLIGTSLADPTTSSVGVSPRPQRNDAPVPSDCTPFTSVPADSTSETLPWAQRLSLAACRQEVTLEPASEPAAYRDRIARIDDALAPSIAMYEDARAHGPTPEIQILAAYGLGMTHQNSIVRAYSAVRFPAVSSAFGGQSYGQTTAIDRSVEQQFEPLLAHHRSAAAAAFRDVVRLAGDHPDAARANPVMEYVVADARTRVEELPPPESTVTSRR